MYKSKYISPIGELLIAAEDSGICGLWFFGQKYFGCVGGSKLDLSLAEYKENHSILDAKRWLDIYFSGKEPDFVPRLSFCGTSFQNEVWGMLAEIPYGETVTYGELSKKIGESRGKKMSSQAVGGAVGRNPISIIIPCHRVLGNGGAITGYAGGIDKKIALLRLEKSIL